MECSGIGKTGRDNVELTDSGCPPLGMAIWQERIFIPLREQICPHKSAILSSGSLLYPMKCRLLKSIPFSSTLFHFGLCTCLVLWVYQNPPSRHIRLSQQWINVDSTYWHWFNIDWTVIRWEERKYALQAHFSMYRTFSYKRPKVATDYSHKDVYGTKFRPRITCFVGLKLLQYM